MSTLTLSVNRLTYGYDTALFNALDFTCQRGEVTAILGANGLGKTTLLHTLIGIQSPLSGEIIRQGAIGLVPQSFHPPAYSVLDIVLMGRASSVGLFDMPEKKDRQIAKDALKQLNISQLENNLFTQLSGGQRQLVLIARALAMQCQTLILDEPATALDLYNQRVVLRLLRRLATEQRISVIFTTHDPVHAHLIADKTLLLMPEKRWIYGQSAEVLSEHSLKQTYGVSVKFLSIERGDRTYRALVPLLDIDRD